MALFMMIWTCIAQGGHAVPLRFRKYTTGFLVCIALAFCVMQPAKADVPIALARAETPLNGPWAFRMGNDPRWANPQFDDRDWERVDLTPAAGAHDGDVGIPGYVPGWTSLGHSGRWGHAWYRLHVRWSVPAGSVPVLAGPTLVDGAYEIYWNGRRIGGIGDFAAAPPRVYAARPKLFQLGETKSAGEGVLAIHVYLPKELVGDPEAGGIHVAPILAEPTAGDARLLAQWWLTFWGYVVDLVEPLVLLILALFALSLRRFSSGDRFLPLAAATVTAIALSRINQPLFYWTEVESLQTLIVVRYAVFNPLAVVLWIIACYRLGGCSDRRIDALACLFGILAGIAALPGVNAQLLVSIARVALLVLFCGSAFYVARNSRQRYLALPTMLVMAVALFPSELSAIGVPGIWFPFGVGVSRTQFALALAIPLLALFLHFRTSALSSEARHSGQPTR
ncbi:MAG: glycoside hydrolase [Mucilaginibacter sp.]|nr:glycoside hydrolase [Mucilaginibacter sp.]